MSQSVDILIIEDDLDTCEMVGDLLQLKGYAVETAGRGQEGLEKLCAHPFDAAIVDIILPDISGLDLLKAIKEASPETEVIFITGYAWLQTAIQAMNGAAFAYLLKPFDTNQLLAMLSKAVEKRRLAKALQEADERYRLITESINDAIFLVDPEGRLVFSNRRSEELTGYRQEELWGRPILPLLTTQGAQQAWARLEAVQAGQVGPPLFETEFIRKDGSQVWVEVNLATVMKEGRVVGRLGVVRDISERKQLQEQLVQAEKLATLGELIAGIAHELNNPLAVMVGYAELLRMAPQETEVATYVDRIIEAAQRATRVVRNFLTFARRHRPQKAAVSVNDIVTKTLELLAYQFRVNSIEVETSLAPTLPPIGADPYQLQQVLLNLLNNAHQAMAATHERGTLRVATALSPDCQMISITVADDGPGISAQHLPRIFEPFFTTKPAGQGTGLGLPIARGIVTEHGGTIRVESVEGGGTTFVVSVPVSAAPPAPPTPAESMATPTGLTVLVVDDEVPLRAMMKVALTRGGNRVETAASGREALAILARSPVDVLVLDVRMPEVAGTDLWTEINRSNPALARRTVFCTGDVVAEDTRAFLDSTGCPTVTKPFGLTQLLDAVARAASR